MKLTKAQRLFMKAGIADNELRENQRFFKKYCEAPKANNTAWRSVNRKIKQIRARRKQLIREALRAYELEIGDAFSAGHALSRVISEDAPMVIEDEEQTVIF